MAEAKEEKDSVKEAPSVTVNSSMITSRESTSRLLAVWLAVVKPIFSLIYKKTHGRALDLPGECDP